MARAPVDEPDSKLSDSTRGFNSLSALASTARVGSPQTIQGHARPGLKMTSCLNGRRDGVQVFVVQHLPQPGRSFQPHTAKPSCIWKGVQKHGMGILAPMWPMWPMWWPTKRQICEAPPARRRARPVRWNGRTRSGNGKSCTPVLCGQVVVAGLLESVEWHEWHRSTAQHSAVTARNGAERLAGSALAPAIFGASSAPALPLRARGARKLVWVQPPGTLSRLSIIPRHLSTSPFRSRVVPLLLPPFPPRPNVTLLRVPVAKTIRPSFSCSFDCDGHSLDSLAFALPQTTFARID